MDAKFRGNKYSLSSNLIFGTFLIGLTNLFLYDSESMTDFIMVGVVVILRYVLAVMIKRRFSWSIYLLIILLIRSAYRAVHIIDNISVNPIAKVNIILQLILSILAFGILFVIPKINKLRNIRRNNNIDLEDVQIPFSK